eukprot:6469990-Amphidinium_carterae.1
MESSTSTTSRSWTCSTFSVVAGHRPFRPLLPAGAPPPDPGLAQHSQLLRATGPLLPARAPPPDPGLAQPSQSLLATGVSLDH